MYHVLFSFRLCYIQFKEVKILWKPGAEGVITQTPKEKLDFNKFTIDFKIYKTPLGGLF